VKNDIGNRIRRERLMRNLKQEQVAEELGMSAGNYGKIERGDISISISQLERLAAVFQLSLAELVIDSQKQPEESPGYGYVPYSEFQALVHDFRALVNDVDVLKSYVQSPISKSSGKSEVSLKVASKRKTASRNK
jgi:transcriptional regulator with XRE-family HTH domain